jgi:pantothenate kinase
METSFDDLVARARALAAGRRALLGLTGAPGAGKSTLAARLVTALSPAAALVPMDGFHLADAELERLGRRHRKGAPDTFDAAGYVETLRRIRARPPDPVYAPVFDRHLEAAVAGSIPVGPDVPLVVTEGNYLLLDDGPWRHVRALLDEVWFVEIDDRVRVERLVRRHVEHGKDPVRADAWVRGSDEANARLVAATRGRADLVVSPAAS